MITPEEAYPKLAKVLDIDSIYFKREDLHPYHSHKGRSIPVMIDHYYAAGDRRFAISSSGNGALAAGLHVQKLNYAIPENDPKLELDIFVGIHIDQEKLVRLKELANDQIRILTKERPLQALTLASQEGVRSLRQSTDDVALLGYHTLAQEIATIKGVGSVFIASSSGTTAQALAQYFLDQKLPIQVHIVQTTSCHPFVDDFELYQGSDEPSIADAIVGQSAPRRDTLVALIKKTGGYAWVATNDEIYTAQDMTLEHTSLEISTNSALPIVGVMQAVYRGWDFGGSVVCIIGGK